MESAKLALPLSRSAASSSSLLSLTNTGDGPAIEAANSGTGPGVKVSMSGSTSQRAIDVVHQGSGVGVLSSTQGGISLWGISGSSSAPGVLGDNLTGEGVLGRSTGGAGMSAIVGRSNSVAYGVRGFSVSTGIGVLGQGGISGGTGGAGRFENVNAANTSDVLAISSLGNGALIQAYLGGDARFRVTAAGNVFADGAHGGGTGTIEMLVMLR